MKTPSFKCLLSLFTLALSIAAWADITWTGESGGNWSDRANWEGDSGAYVISKPGTINFNAPLNTIGTTGADPALKISAGTESLPVTFTTGTDDNQELGLTMENGANHAAIGAGSNAGYLVVDGGKYIFANDLVVGGKDKKNGTLVVKRGLVGTMYWMYICGYEASSCSGLLKVEGGTVQVGTGNGRLVIGQQSGTTATLEQIGGTVTSGQNEAALEIACNNATGTYNISGGSYTGNGNAWLGNGDGSKAYVNVSGSGNMSLTGDFILGYASGSYGELNLNGGTLTVASLKRGSGKGKIVFNGGTLKPQGENTAFMPANEDFDVQIAEGGLVIDTAHNITISAKIYGSGPITKKGSGTVTFSGDAIYYTGTVTTESGAGDVIFASGAWRGTAADQSGNYLVSEPTNWHQGQVPSGIAFFGGAESAGKTVTFGANLNLSGDVEVISWSSGNNNYYADEDGWCTWKATDPSYGVKQTAGALLIGQGESGTGRLAISSGTHNFSGKIRVGDWKGTGYLKVDGGYVESADEVYIAGDSAHSTGKVYVNGGALVNRNWFCVGRAGDCDAYLEVNGGAVSNLVNNLTIGTCGNSSSKAEMLVKKGEVYTAGNLYVGEWDSATVTVQGGDVIVKGNVVFGDSTNFGLDETATLNIEGGTIIAKQFNKGAGSGTATLNLKGGTIKAAGDANSYIIYAESGRSLSVALAEGTTSTIDVNGQDQHINVPLSGTGTLRVTGGGSLALGAGMTYTGTTAVEAGTTLSLSDTSATTSRLILRGGSVSVPANFSVAEVELASGGEVALPSWYTTNMKLIISGDTTLVVPQGTTLGDVEFKDNGKIVYTLSTYTAGETANVATIGTVTYPENDTIANHVYISVDGVHLATVSDVNGTLTAVSRENVWIGEAGSAVDYAIPAQWKSGTPTGYDILVFNRSGTISSSKGQIKVASAATVSVAQALTIDALAIGVGGGTVDTGSYAVTVSNLKSVEGTLGFAGSGTVSISAAPAVPFGIVLSGTVTATVPYTTKLSSLSFAAGNLLYVDVSELSEATTLETPCPIALPQGYSDPNWFIAPKGKRAAFVYNYDDGIKLSSMRVPAEGESVVNVYLGGGNWSTTGNWSLNALPASADIALITLANQTIEDNVADKINVSNIVVKTAYVKFKGGNVWPKIRAQEINGIDGSRIELSCYGLGPVSGKNLEVKVDVEASNLENRNQDCWIEGNDSTSRIAFYGDLYANESAFRVNGNVDFYGQVVCNYTSDNDNYFSGDVTFKTGSSLTVGANGTVTINTAIEFPGEVTVNGTLHEKAGCTFCSALKGSGTLNLSSGNSVVTHFKGANSGFSGTINAAKKHVPYLYRIASGSENAVWNINTDMRYVGDESGTLKFGALNVSKGDWNWFYIRRGLSNLVIEVGGRNDDMTWGEEYGFGGYNGSAADFNTTDAKFKKVGSGVLYTRASNYPSIEVAEGVVSFEDDDGPSTSYVFSGGTFRFNSSTYPDPTVKFDLTNSSGPVDIDTAGHTFTWATAITGAFDLVKRGDGTLALTGAHTYTGKTEVKGGVLILPYREFGNQTVSVADDAILEFDASKLTVVDNPAALFTSNDATIASRVRILGSADYDFTLQRDSSTGAVTYNATAKSDTDARNIWVGGTEGDWNLARNWTRGVPTEEQTVLINSDVSDVTIFSSTDTASPLLLDTLEVDCGNFTFRASSKDRAPMLKLKAIKGSGKITLSRAGLENVSGVEMVVENDIDFGASDNGYDSWLAANGARVEYKGNLTVLSTCGKFMTYGYNYLHLSGSFVNNSLINADSCLDYTCIDGDLRCNGKMKIGNSTVNGAITVTANQLEINNSTINGKTTVTSAGQLYINTGNTLNGDVEVASGGVYGIDHECVLEGAMDNSGTVNIWNAANLKGTVNVNAGGKVKIMGNSRIDGDITGSGTVETSNENKSYTLSGNNREFYGTFNHYANGRVYFKSADSGSPNAVWDIAGDADTTALTSGTLKFGALNLSNQKLWFQNSDSTLVMEVGALGRGMQFGGNYFFGTESYNSGTNPENVTLKIVGGKLTNASYGIRKMVVAGGEMVLATPTHGDGAWESYKNNYAGYQIDSIVVAKDGILSGTTDQTISGLTLAPGAIVKQTVTGSGTSESPYTCPTLTVNGNVNVAGVKFAVDGVDLSQVTSGENANLTLLSATGTVKGTPVAAEKIVTGGGYGWKPVVVDKSVLMQFGKLAAGFMLMAF